MKIRVLNGLLIIDILTILLIVAIIYAPSNVARVVLGLPFVLFFPGYALFSALFVEKEEIGGIEQLAVCCGLSIAISALIGLGLNYTPWGIRLDSVLYSIATFVIVVSAITRIRRAFKLKRGTLVTEIKLGKVSLGNSLFNKSLSIILIMSILLALGVLGYTVVNSKTGEKFTEFYMLGLSGQAQNYPMAFTLNGGHVKSVQYNAGGSDISTGWGKVTLGIVNHEQQKTIYSVEMKIDNEATDLNYNGITVNRITDIQLQPDEKWEHEIGFAPQHLGDNQKVEFLLFKGDSTVSTESLHLWINVTEAPH